MEIRAVSDGGDGSSSEEIRIPRVSSTWGPRRRWGRQPPPAEARAPRSGLRERCRSGSHAGWDQKGPCCRFPL